MKKQKIQEETDNEEKSMKQCFGECYDLKLELRLHLGKGLREVKECIEVVKLKDTG